MQLLNNTVQDRYSYRYQTGSMLIGTSISFMLLAFLILSVLTYLQQNVQQAERSFQLYQASQLASNQANLLLAGQDCQTTVHLNQVLFKIQCDSNQIRVTYPLGFHVLSL